MNRKMIDWEAVELQYRAGIRSLKDIGREFDVSDAAIVKRARKEGWIRPEKGKPVSAKLAALEPRQQRFVQEYLIDLNGTQAAIRAGYSANTAAEQSYDLLRKPQIQRAIKEGQEKLQAKLEMNAERVVQTLARIATADPRELVEVKTGCCRCCYGEGHKWQRTVGEMNRDREAWIDKGNDPSAFDEKGGIGFNPHRDPNPVCQECVGRGQGRTFISDTRNLSPAAAALYAGVKETKDGFEIKMHSKLDAIEKLAKHLGIYEKDNQQKADPLTALLHTIAKTSGNAFVPVVDDPDHFQHDDEGR